jgi:hypothetical protein
MLAHPPSNQYIALTCLWVDLDMIESLSEELELGKETNMKLRNTRVTQHERLKKKDEDIVFLKGQIT